MDKFDQFDFVAYLAPGALVLISFGLLWAPSKKLPFGDATVAVALAIASYVLGHICAAVGSAAWRSYSRLSGQLKKLEQSNDEWLLEGLDGGQWFRFTDLIQTRLSRVLTDKDRLNDGSWNLGRQMYADVAAHGGGVRLDAYMRSYRFYLALQVAVVFIGLMVAVKVFQSHDFYTLLLWIPLAIVACACSWQAHEYNAFYTRELVQQFLLLPNLSPEAATDCKSPKST